MSASADRQRKEEFRDAAIERGKAKLRLQQAVLVHFAEGRSARETAEHLDVCERTVRKYWGVLELSTRRGQVRKAAEPAPVADENSSVSTP
ncbi:MAG: hypothetical protein Q8L14_08440 [Myxococcales bacterium]|nr:hypothetical protein [Myxococcales bacterium]